MKNTYSILVLMFMLCAFASCDSNKTPSEQPTSPEPEMPKFLIDSIKDIRFREIILNDFDIDKDDELSQEEADFVNKITLVDTKIESLDGIEIFKNLKIFICIYNTLEVIDLSENLNLNHIFCGNNRTKNLYIGNNTNLEYLYCYVNYISFLDISYSLSLKEFNCSNNPSLESVIMSTSQKDCKITKDTHTKIIYK